MTISGRQILIWAIFGMIIPVLSGQSSLSVLEYIEVLGQRHQVSFGYNSAELQSLYFQEISDQWTLAESLQYLSEQTAIEYQIINEHKVLLRIANQKPGEPNLFRISGKVFDHDSREPLAYAAVYTDDLAVGTSTNEEGHFELSLTNNDSALYLNIQYLGFQSQRIPVPTGKQDVEILLLPIIQEIPAITLEEQKPLVTGFSRDYQNISHDLLKVKGPSLIRDPLRSLQLLPGFYAHNDLSVNSGFRGSKPEANLFMLDHMPIVEIDHFFGIFSAIQEGTTESIDLYRNNFPVHYPARTGALVHIHTLPQPEQATGSIQIDNLTAQAHLNIPIARRWQLMLGGRSTLMDISNDDTFGFLYDEPTPRESRGSVRREFIRADPRFTFYDVVGKLRGNLSDRTEIIFKYFGGGDQFSYDYQRNFEVKYELLPRPRMATEQFEEIGSWNNQAYGLEINHEWSARWTTQLLVQRSQFDKSEGTKLFYKEGIRPAQTERFRIRNEVDFWNVQLNQAYQFPKGTIQFGYQQMTPEASSTISFNQNEIAPTHQSSNHTIFAGLSSPTGQSWQWEVGWRSTYDQLLDRIWHAPRVQASHIWNDRFKIKGSIGHFQQSLRQSYVEDLYGNSRSFWIIAHEQNREIPLLSSTNAMLGWSLLGHHFSIDLEGYIKRSQGNTEYAQEIIPRTRNASLDLVRNFLFFTGSGLSYGLDLQTQWEVGKWQSVLSYSLSKSEVSYPQINRGNPYPAQDDRRHQLKWVNEYRVGAFSFYNTFVYTTGKRFLDLPELSARNIFQISRDRLEDFIDYFPAYRRLDIGGEWNFSISKRVSGSLGASVFNVLNWDNIAYEQSVYEIGESEATVFGNTVSLLDATPTLFMALHF